MEPTGSKVDIVPSQGTKRTCRTFYRLLILILNLIIIILTIISIYVSISTDQHKLCNNEADSLLHSIVEPITVPLGTDSDVEDELREIRRDTGINIPIQIDNTENIILTTLASINSNIARLHNATDESPTCLSPVNDPRFIAGINKITKGSMIYRNFSNLIEHVNFIPSPTTLSGCTRIPSFSLSKTHWCYSHNVISTGCQDHAASSQYISIGIVDTGLNNEPYLRTMSSRLLNDGLNRKSCSVTAGAGVCWLLCSVVTESESADYRSRAPTAMILGRFNFYGDYTESPVPASLFSGRFTANYPGVGSGTQLNGTLYFPIYGGVVNDSDIELSNRGKSFRPRNPTNPCPDPEVTQSQRAQASYYPTRFGRLLIQQAILACRISDTTCTDYYLLYFDNNQVMMGAEARIYYLNNQMYLYQRSSSWWPHPLFYRFSLPHCEPMSVCMITDTHLILTYATSRPGTSICTGASRCPNNCVDGVYTDVWPLTEGTTQDPDSYYTVFLNSPNRRISPTISIYSYNQKISSRLAVGSEIGAAYTTSTCFSRTDTGALYCITIIEAVNTIFGQYRIVPILVQLISD
ncbi:hemagglutinin [Paraavulavirus wisconsinense]|uniref:Hemagglutinin-neuraminidase n=1 Tax=Paraavulavirus wisconsinense TaxID=3052594 RepID=D5FGX6_9MONO|nr:hemagglutinin [Paraavulavirus wisconsinense]ACI47552.1 hemagglutinin [Paraavulavirus wisconsinense]